MDKDNYVTCQYIYAHACMKFIFNVITAYFMLFHCQVPIQPLLDQHLLSLVQALVQPHRYMLHLLVSSLNNVLIKYYVTVFTQLLAQTAHTTTCFVYCL